MSQTTDICLRVSTRLLDTVSQEPQLRRWAAQQEGKVR
jgi:hypothetical protein